MAAVSKSYVKHPTKREVARPASTPAAKSYIEFPKPLRALATSNWKVADLCAAYKIPKGTCEGGGVIGILELGGGWTQADLDKFSANNGLPPIAVTDMPIGGTNSPGGAADGEVLLDIQVAAAVYYYATGKMPTIKVFWAQNTFDAFGSGVTAALGANCDVLSISWGADEQRWEQGAPGAAKTLEGIVADAANKGLAVFAAAGDNASGDGGPGANVDMPSACPHAIACGGTTKFRGAEEVVWGSGNPDGEGTGGGYSDIFSPMPDWQSTNGAPPGTNGGRMVPDVAANADPQTGYLVVINGVEQAIGGTSAVAPFYAGLLAAFGQKLGFVGETLWKNRSAFTDIVKGSNGDFSATVGPDPCTGLGVPIGTELAAIFSAYKPAVQLQGQIPAAGTRVSGASYSSFALWHGNGPVKLQINDTNITADSRVFAAVSEYATDARVDRFIGSSQMTVFNIAPANGHVTVWLNVNWGSPLNVRVDYFVDPQQI